MPVGDSVHFQFHTLEALSISTGDWDTLPLWISYLDIIDDLHRPAAQHIGWANQDRVSYSSAIVSACLVVTAVPLLGGIGSASAGCQSVAVFSASIFTVADNMNSSSFRVSVVYSGLTAELHYRPSGVPSHNIKDISDQRLKIKSV